MRHSTIISFIISNTIIKMVLISLFFLVSGNFYPEKPPKLEHFDKILYVDRDFTPQEVSYIAQAALEWNSATHHIVNFTVERLPNDHIMIDKAIIIMRASEDHPDVILSDHLDQSKNLLGYYANEGIPHILLIPDRISKFFRSIILHELGHAIGLRHSMIKHTLMYPARLEGSNYITKIDLMQFCYYYDCSKSE